MASIIQYPNDILLRKSVDVIDYMEEVNDAVGDMMNLLTETQGAGLSAPQIGINKNFFLVTLPLSAGWKLYVNPKVLWASPVTWKRMEGCLSISGGKEHYKVTRPYAVYVSYQDQEMVLRKKFLYGWDARVFLHEFDHLQGKLIN